MCFVLFLPLEASPRAVGQTFVLFLFCGKRKRSLTEDTPHPSCVNSTNNVIISPYRSVPYRAAAAAAVPPYFPFSPQLIPYTTKHSEYMMLFLFVKYTGMKYNIVLQVDS